MSEGVVQAVEEDSLATGIARWRERQGSCEDEEVNSREVCVYVLHALLLPFTSA